MTSKLRVVGEHYCDFSKGLPLARSLRERIDWMRVRAETKESPYAMSFLHLVEQLDIVRPEERDLR